MLNILPYVWNYGTYQKPFESHEQKRIVPTARPGDDARMNARLFWFEFSRMLAQARLWLVVAAFGLFGAYTVFEVSPWWGNVSLGGVKNVGAFGIFSQHSVWIYAFASPLIAGLTTAGSLAADRHKRFPALVMARGISRRRYLLVKAASMGSAAGLATFASCGLILLTALALLPWNPTTLAGNSLQRTLLPGLFAYSPVLYDLFLAGIVSLASASLALSGLVVGSMVTNEYVAAAVPLVLVLGGTFATGNMPLLPYLSPDVYLWLLDVYPYSVPPVWRPFAAPLYWVLFGAACTVVGTAIFLRREPD